MKKLSIPSILFAASLAMPSLAQDARSPATGPVFRCEAELELGVVLVALDERLVPFGGHLVLEPEVVLPMVAVNGRCVCKVALPDGWDLRFYWQIVGIAHDGSLSFGDVGKFDPESAALANGGDKKAPLIPSGPPLNLTAARDASGALIAVHAGFIAPTDGYGLAVIDVADTDGDGTVEVYLYRKLAGSDAGRMPIQEKFAVTAKILPGTRQVEVLLAEGTTSRPHDGTSYLAIGRFHR